MSLPQNTPLPTPRAPSPVSAGSASQLLQAGHGGHHGGQRRVEGVPGQLPATGARRKEEEQSTGRARRESQKSRLTDSREHKQKFLPFPLPPHSQQLKGVQSGKHWGQSAGQLVVVEAPAMKHREGSESRVTCQKQNSSKASKALQRHSCLVLLSRWGIAATPARLTAPRERRGRTAEREECR